MLTSKFVAGKYAIVVVILTVYVRVASPEAFTSTANLLQLVQAEEDVLPLLEKFVEEEESKLHELNGYIGQIQGRPEYEVNRSGGLFYAGHPVNSYNLIKRWYKMSQMVRPSPALEALSSKLEALPLPTTEDFDGANAAILRLQRVFLLSPENVMSGEIYGFKSAQRLRNEDAVSLGETAVTTADFGLAVQWFQFAEKKVTSPELLKRVHAGLLEACQKINDPLCALETVGKVILENPEDESLRSTQAKLRREVQALGDNEPHVNGTTWQRPIPDWRINYEALCRGERDATADPNYAKDLVCFYKKGKIPYVQYKHEVLSWEPRIGMFYEVISDANAKEVINRAYPLLARGMVGDPKNPAKSTERISKLAWLWDSDPFIKKLSARVSDITGLETKYNDLFSSSEPFQVVNYGMGGQYEPHVDYYEDPKMRANVPPFLQGTGDRISTFLFYLSDVPVGGSTVYPRAKVRVPPVKNAAAFWYNCKLSGEFDKRTEHAGCPVLIGQKWVTNKWIREYGQEFRRPCALEQRAIDTTIS